MVKLLQHKSSHSKLKRQLLIVMLVIFGWSIAIGFILGLATNTQALTPANIGTVDIVPAKYQFGQQLYLENCSSCHIAIPPAVFPSQTWKNLLEDSQHYGVQITPLDNFQQRLVSKYLFTFSRPQLQDEITPYRFHQSRYFRALHPGVKLPQPVTVGTCVSCHLAAQKYNFREVIGDS
jgi:hypothetical protein